MNDNQFLCLCAKHYSLAVMAVTLPRDMRYKRYKGAYFLVLFLLSTTTVPAFITHLTL